MANIAKPYHWNGINYCLYVKRETCKSFSRENYCFVVYTIWITHLLKGLACVIFPATLRLSKRVHGVCLCVCARAREWVRACGGNTHKEGTFSATVIWTPTLSYEARASQKSQTSGRWRVARQAEGRQLLAKDTAWLTWEAGPSTVINSAEGFFSYKLMLRSQVFCFIVSCGLVISSRCFEE